MQDELPRRLRRGCETRACTGSPPVASDARTSAAHVERAAPSVGAQPAGAAARPRDGDLPGSASRARANSSGVIAAKSFVRRSSSRAPAADLDLAAVDLRARARRARPSGARRLRRGGRRRSAAERLRREEPRVERAVERLEVLAARRRASAAASSRRRPAARARPRRARAARRRLGRGPTSSPPSRSTRPNMTTCRTTACGSRRRAQSRALATSPASASSRTASRSSWYLSTEPSVASTFSTSSSCCPSAVSACAQSIVSARPGGFCRSSAASSATKRAASCGEPLGHARARAARRSRSPARPTDGRSSGRGSAA